MRKILLAVMGAALITGTGALTVPASAATTCTGPLTGPLSGPVTVPAGATCIIDGATVSGAVNVSPGGRLVIFNNSTINGSVNSDRAGTDTSSLPIYFSIVICNTHITGSVNITRATSNVLVGDEGEYKCYGNGIDGSVTLSSNAVGAELLGNTIKGSVTVNSNHGSTHDDPESAEVGDNSIGGSLSCSGNDNGVTPGSGSNTAASKNGQCRASLGF